MTPDRCKAFDAAMQADPLPVVQALQRRIDLAISKVVNVGQLSVTPQDARALADYIRQSEMRADTLRKLQSTLRHAGESIGRHERYTEEDFE